MGFFKTVNVEKMYESNCACGHTSSFLDNTYLVYAVVPAGVILAAVFGALCYVWLQRRRAAKREGGAAIAVDLDADPEGDNIIK